MALVIVGILGVLGIIAVIVAAAIAVDSVDEALNEVASTVSDAPSDPGTSEDDDSSQQEPEQQESETTDAAEPAGGDEASDVESCTIVDEFTVSFDLINQSSKQSSYIIDANYLDASGVRIGDEPFFVNYIRPGEAATAPSFGSVPDGAESCEIAKVDRFAAESPNDIGEVSCEVTGVDFADDIATSLVAMNGSSELSDYFISFAVIRAERRIGDGFASIDNVRAGETAPGDGFGTVDGPAEGVTCEVVHVLRTAS